MERNLRKRRSYTAEEVAEHCYPESLWIIIAKKVYDVTDFLDTHPGGADLLLEYAGADATQYFRTLHQHSDIAYEMMERYYIGDLWECESQSDTSLDSTDTSPSGSKNSSDEAEQQGERAPSDHASSVNLGAGPSSSNHSGSRYQANGGLTMKITSLLRDKNSIVEPKKCSSCERNETIDRNSLIFALSVFVVGTVIAYRLSIR